MSLFLEYIFIKDFMWPLNDSNDAWMESKNKIYNKKSIFEMHGSEKKKNIRVLWRANTLQVKYGKRNIDSSHLTHMRYKERVPWSAEQNARARNK